MTPAEAVERMRAAVVATAVPDMVDRETEHRRSDKVLVEIARAAGYGEAADLWVEASERWWWA